MERMRMVFTGSGGQGAITAAIIISEEEINNPKVIQPNMLVCLAQEAYNGYAAIFRPGDCS